MYLSKLIDQVLEDNKSALLGRQFYGTLANKLNHAFFEHENFTFIIKKLPVIWDNSYAISGLYDQETNIKVITLNFSQYSKKFDLNLNNWEGFKFNVSQVCQHEKIHQLQWQHRDTSAFTQELIDFRTKAKNKRLEEKMYLADPDEVDAYAHDIAMEIKLHYGNQDPYLILKNINKKRKIWSYNYYKNTFKGDNWYNIRRRLLLKIYMWLPHV